MGCSMDRKSLLLVTLILPFSANAAVYQCADGKYQADPCDENSHPVDLSGVGSVVKGPDIAHASAVIHSDKKQEISDFIDKQRISREITKLENDRKLIIDQRDKRIVALRNDRSYANNNLAGATWEQSLAQEMSAVAQQADTQVASIDRQIEQLRLKLK